MKQKIILLSALLFASLGTSSYAQLFNHTNSSESIQSLKLTQPAQMLIDYMRESKELEADFTQVAYNQRGEEISQGHMWIQKPGKFFWDYQAPYAQEIVSDGKKVYHYDKDLEQITVRDKSDIAGDIAVRLLEGQQSIQDEFNIQLLSEDQLPDYIDKKSNTVFSLTPRDTQAEYNQIWVVFDKEQLSQVIIDGGIGQQTVMQFKNLKRNHGINPDKFNFIAPKGVDIIGN